MIRDRAVDFAAQTSTTIKVAGNVAALGPNTLVALSEVPENISEGISDIKQGFKEGGTGGVLGVALGSARILKATGDMASAALLAESGFQAAQTRTMIGNAYAPAPPGTHVPRPKVTPNTGKTPGTTYIREVETPQTATTRSHLEMKTTTAVSKEGVVVRQHTDLYSRYARTEWKNVPEAVTGIKDILPTAPHYSRSATITVHAVVKPANDSSRKEQ